jgi:diguanylate cyclase (GGDEF)-like protein
VYALLARLGEAILPLDGIAALWPASGFAAVMLLWAQTTPRRIVVLLGIVLGIGVSILVRGMLFTNELGYLMGNLVEPLVMLPFLALAVRPSGRMDRLVSVLWLVVGSLVAAAAAGAVVASFATWSFDGTGDFAGTWPATWLSFTSGDLLGLLLVAPLMLQAHPVRRLWSRGSVVEQGALWVALAVSLLLTGVDPLWAFVGLVIVIVMALRLESSAASLGALLVSAALVLDYLQTGGAVGPSMVTSIDIRLVLPLVAVLTQLVAMGTTERVAAAALAQAERAEADRSRATLRRALDSGLDAFAIFERTGAGAWELVFVNAAGAARSGAEADALQGASPERVVAVEAVQQVVHLMDRAHATGDSQQTLADLTGSKSGWRGDFDITVTPTSGNRVVVTWRDVSDLQSAHRSLRSAHAAAMHAATHDGLTNLPNRPLLLDRMRTGLASLARAGGRMAVMYLDIDSFKLINDRFGHAMGDAVLIAVARRLAMLTREGDTAARISGDEFALVLTGVDDNWDEEAFHRRLAAAVGDPIDHEGISLTVSLSTGLVLAESSDRTPDELLQDADLALYASKDQGKGRLTVFRDELREVGVAGRPTPDELHAGIVGGQLELVYQPVVELGSGRQVGREALVRWRHPLYGVLPPAQFLDLADSTGLIADVGQWVLRTAIADVAGLDDDLWVSVNLAPSQLLRAPVASEAGSWCQEFGVAPERLVLEVTEGQLLEATPAVLRQLAALRALGARLAIDDFGSGYSSIAYLETFEFDIIKLDQGLLQGAHTDRKLAMISWVAELARMLDCVTIAEGIEDESQAELTRAAGIDLGQGFLFGRPAPLAVRAPTARA